MAASPRDGGQLQAILQRERLKTYGNDFRRQDILSPAPAEAASPGADDVTDQPQQSVDARERLSAGAASADSSTSEEAGQLDKDEADGPEFKKGDTEQRPAAESSQAGAQEANPWKSDGFRRMYHHLITTLPMSDVRTLCYSAGLISDSELDRLMHAQRDGSHEHNEKLLHMIRRGNRESFREFVNIFKQLPKCANLQAQLEKLL